MFTLYCLGHFKRFICGPCLYFFMFPLLASFLEGEDDEDEEDEEEEDEEEEDEEEDEEDKDADSLDEALGDTELPGLTLPGVTSQEPGLEQENVVSLEGVTFQVPDAVQWEQQNQGLGESCVFLSFPPPLSLLFLGDDFLSLALIMEQNGFSFYGCFIWEVVLTSFSNMFIFMLFSS